MAESLASRLRAYVRSTGGQDFVAAKRLGVTPATLSRWMAGQVMPREAANIAAICRELDITAEEYGALVGNQLGQKAETQARQALEEEPPDR